MNDRLKEFRDGLTRVKLSILVTAFAVSAILLLALETIVSLGIYTAIPIPEEQLLLHPHDDHMHVSYLTAQLKTKRTDYNYPLYLLGGSSMRESIDSPESLSQMIESRWGVQVRTHQLASSSQTMAETLAIVDNLPSGNGIVVIGINYHELLGTSVEENISQLEGYKLLLRSKALKDAVGLYESSSWIPYTIMPGILKQVRLLAERNYNDYERSKPARAPYVLHAYEKADQKSASMKKGYVQEWKSLFPTYYSDKVALNVLLLKKIIETCKGKGLQVVLLDLPVNKELIGNELDDVHDFYREVTTDIARAYNIEHFDYIWQLGIPDDQFVDLSHLLAGKGRELYIEKLLQEMSPYFIALQRK